MLRCHGKEKKKDEWAKYVPKLPNIRYVCSVQLCTRWNLPHGEKVKWENENKNIDMIDVRSPYWCVPPMCCVVCTGLRACAEYSLVLCSPNELHINYPIMWWITWVIFLLIDYSLQKKWLMDTCSTFILATVRRSPIFFAPSGAGERWGVGEGKQTNEFVFWHQWYIRSVRLFDGTCINWSTDLHASI